MFWIKVLNFGSSHIFIYNTPVLDCIHSGLLLHAEGFKFSSVLYDIIFLITLFPYKPAIAL